MSFSQRRPAQQALRPVQEMPQDQAYKRLEDSENFTTSATVHDNLGMTPSHSVPAPTPGQQVQPTSSGTENRATGQLQQTMSNNAPSLPHRETAIQKNTRFMKKYLEKKVPVLALEAGSGFKYEAHIWSEQDFNEKMAAYLALNDRKTPDDSIDDFPENPQFQQILVQQLVEAMLNFDEETVLDENGKLPKSRIKKLSFLELELMAWKVLLETRDIHHGKISIPSWGKEWPWQDFTSFSDRFKAVKKSLFMCKAMVSSLFDETFAKRLPLNPAAEIGRKISNKKLNGQRQKDLALAKTVKRNRLRGTPESFMSTTDGQSSSPQRASSREPTPKRRRRVQQIDVADEDPFSSEQNTAPPLSDYELRHKKQMEAGNFQFPENNGSGRSIDVSDFTGSSYSSTGSMSGSPSTIPVSQGRVGHIGHSTSMHNTLLRNNADQWPNMDNNLDPALSYSDLVQPPNQQQWTDHAQSSRNTSSGNMTLFRGRKKSSGPVTAQLPPYGLQSSTNNQQGTVSGSLPFRPAIPQIVQKDQQGSSVYEAPQIKGTMDNTGQWLQGNMQNPGAPMVGTQDEVSQDPFQMQGFMGVTLENGPQLIGEQTPLVFEDFLGPVDATPLSAEDFQTLWNSSTFDMDSGAWKQENGEGK